MANNSKITPKLNNLTETKSNTLLKFLKITQNLTQDLILPINLNNIPMKIHNSNPLNSCNKFKRQGNKNNKIMKKIKTKTEAIEMEVKAQIVIVSILKAYIGG